MPRNSLLRVSIHARRYAKAIQRSCKFKPQPSLLKCSAYPGYKVFPAAHSFMHASSSIFWCSSEPGKPAEPAYPSEKRQRESKKSKVVKFHPILCMPAPSFDRSQREIQVRKHCTRSQKKISKCLETNERKETA